MKTRVKKWGNSFALRIPKSFAAQAGLKNDSPVEVSLSGKKIIIIPDLKPSLTIKQLLSTVTEDNIHHEINTGYATGREAW